MDILPAPYNIQWISVTLSVITFLLCTAYSVEITVETDATLGFIVFLFGFMAAFLAYGIGIFILAGGLVWAVMLLLTMRSKAKTSDEYNTDNPNDLPKGGKYEAKK